MEWTKDSDQGNTLAYDNTASLFFGAALLTCVLVPWTIKFCMKFIRPNAQKLALRGPLTAEKYCYRKQCECSICIEKNERMIRDARLLRNVTTLSNMFQFAVLCFLWIVYIHLCISSMNVETLDIGAFNPFEILNIAETATPKEIKKAYRALSLMYHPDRNPDDVDAAAIFIRVSKAYSALTDETARKNFEKFGNPDGPGNMKVGLGLPRWVVQEENQLFVLAFFFIVVLMFVPIVFISIHNNMKKYSASGVRVETLQFLSFYMHDGTRAKLAPEFLAASAEARDIPVRERDADCLAKVEKEINALKLYRQTFTMPSVTKNFYLILCHMTRKHDLLDINLRHDLDEILRASPLVTQSMVELAFVNNWLQTVQSVLEFRRCLLQAQSPEQQLHAGAQTAALSLMQIPWFTKERIEAIATHEKGDKKPIRSLRELVRSDYENVLSTCLTDELKPNASQFKDMIAFLKHVPNIEVSAEIFVEGEDQIVVGDFATCLVKIDRLNLKKVAKENPDLPIAKIASGAVHCPFFPGTKFEEWFIFVSDQTSGAIFGWKRVQATTATVDVPVQFRVEPPADASSSERNLIVFVMCDSYSGLDSFAHCKFKIYSESEVQREIVIHPEDAALDGEQGIVQTFMGDIIQESEESESEEFDMDAREGEKSE